MVLVNIFAMPMLSRIGICMLSHAVQRRHGAPAAHRPPLCAPAPGSRAHTLLWRPWAPFHVLVQSGERARCTHTLNTQFKTYLSHSELVYMDPAKSSAILSTCGMADACTGKVGEMSGFGGG